MIMGLVARCDVKEAVELAGELADFLLGKKLKLFLISISQGTG